LEPPFGNPRSRGAGAGVAKRGGEAIRVFAAASAAYNARTSHARSDTMRAATRVLSGPSHEGLAMQSSAPPPNEPIRPTIVPEPPRGPIRVVLEQPRGSWLARGAKWLFSALILLVLVSWYAGSYYETDGDVQERWHSLSKFSLEKIAIISVEGTILGEEGFAKKQIDHVMNDDHVKAVVVRIDSPGGTVTGSDYLYHHLQKMAAERKIPLVVSMGAIAASGGYYIAMATGEKENTVFAEPTTWTGSIGVIIPHYDLTGLLDKIEVKDDSIASNPLKMMGSPTRKFPEAIRAEEQQILKGLVDSSFESFKEIVLASRPALRNEQALQDVVFTGRIFTAKQAVEHRLVDRLGFVEDAIDRAIELAGLDKENVRVVKYHRTQGLFEQLMYGPQSRRQQLDLAALLELSAPKAYYLCTWLPVVSLAPRP
jgi:protease-4